VGRDPREKGGGVTFGIRPVQLVGVSQKKVGGRRLKKANERGGRQLCRAEPGKLASYVRKNKAWGEGQRRVLFPADANGTERRTKVEVGLTTNQNKKQKLKALEENRKKVVRGK